MKLLIIIGSIVNTFALSYLICAFISGKTDITLMHEGLKAMILLLVGAITSMSTLAYLMGEDI